MDSLPPECLKSASREVLQKALRAMEGGEYRSEQEEMLDGVAEAIDAGRHLAVRAGAGVGKSLAYLIPAVLSGRKVVVATETTILQDQLKKDLPFLAKVLPPRFGLDGKQRLSYGTLKGRDNYLCRQRLEEEEQERLVFEEGEDPRSERIRSFLEWAGRTPSGDRSDFEGICSAEVWDMYSVSSNECPGRNNCRHGEACFTERARYQAGQVDVLVVNFALLLTWLSGKAAPPVDILILDEAHGLEKFIFGTLGVSISRSLFEDSARLLEAVESGDGEPLRKSAKDIAQLLRSLRGVPIDSENSSDLLDALGLASERLSEALLSLMDNQTGELIFEGDASERTQEARRQRAISRLYALREGVSKIREQPADFATYVDESGQNLRMLPLDIAAALGKKFFVRSTVILTSATLPGSLPRRLGMPDGKYEQLDVGTSFNYKNSLFYCAKHLPAPNAGDGERIPALLAELEMLIKAAGGRTLALFTSWRVLEIAHAELESRFSWPLLRQERSSGASAELLRRFSSDLESCLFGTMSFWQGVDVPGPSLSLVVIDKLPFPVPDPFLKARQRNEGKRMLEQRYSPEELERFNFSEDDFDRAGFKCVDVPHCAQLLPQGAGRLVRTSTDRGVVALLDPRLATRDYRVPLQELMPPFKKTVNRDEVVQFLSELHGGN